MRVKDSEPILQSGERWKGDVGKLLQSVIGVKLLQEAEKCRMYPMSSLEVMQANPPESSVSERIRPMVSLLRQLQGQVETWKENQQMEPDSVRQRRLAETNTELANLYKSIQMERQNLSVITTEDLDPLKNEVTNVQNALPADGLPWLTDLLGVMQVGIENLAEQKSNDPGAELKAVHDTTKMGGLMGISSLGAVVGGSAATALSASAGVASAAVMGGTMGGMLAVPAIEYGAKKIFSNSPKARAAATAVLYTGAATAAYFLAPLALIPLGVGLGVAGVSNAIGYINRKKAEADAKERAARTTAQSSAPQQSGQRTEEQYSLAA